MKSALNKYRTSCLTRRRYKIHVWTSYHVADVIVILATSVDGELREICLRLGIVPGCGSRSLFGWVRPDYTSSPSRAHIKGMRASAGTQIVEARQCASAIRLAHIQRLGARIHNVDRSSCIISYHIYGKRYLESIDTLRLILINLSILQHLHITTKSTSDSCGG